MIMITTLFKIMIIIIIALIIIMKRTLEIII